MGKPKLMDSCCGALSPKPEGWKLTRYPKCNRPPRHKLPHREYNRKDAKVLHEWDEALSFDETALRRWWSSHNKARTGRA